MFTQNLYKLQFIKYKPHPKKKKSIWPLQQRQHKILLTSG